MNRQERITLFQRMMSGEQDAARQLSDYLRVRGADAEAGNSAAREELEDLAYHVTYAWVEQRMRRRFPYLLQRGHSTASVVGPAWMRVQARPASLTDLPSFCRRIGRMVHYAFIDIVRSQRQWDERHPQLGNFGDAGCSPQQCSDDRPRGDTSSPLTAAMWAEVYERIAALPEDIRTVFDLHHHLGAPFHVIEKQLNLTAYRVRLMWIAALQSLADVIPTRP